MALLSVLGVSNFKTTSWKSWAMNLIMDLTPALIYLFFLFIYLLFYVMFNSQGHIATGSLQVEETAASEVGGENSNRYTTEPPQLLL